jgi:membrane-associated phospholipid phosphatase
MPDPATTPLRPALWHEPAPHHFDLAFPWWSKVLLLLLLTLLSLQFLDAPIAHWVLVTHPIPDLASATARHGDPARELMMLEQWGQVTCSALVIGAVALIDQQGRRRAFAIALACLLTVAACYLLKDLFGRSRPYVLNTGAWIWGGPAMALHNGSPWSSFPSAHTTGAFALSVALSWFYPRARGLFIALALITAAQRVLHAAHFLSDTLAAMTLATLITRSTLHHQLPGRLLNILPAPLQRWLLTQQPTPPTHTHL